MSHLISPGLRRAAGIAALACLAACTGPADRPSPTGYRYYRTGSPADVVRPTRGLWVLQGGGDDVDLNYVRMGEAGGGGDFLVLRASGAGEYNDYVQALCRCDSVETIVFDDRRAASDPFVLDTIRRAEAIFIAGGDQSRYVRFWQGTPVMAAINAHAARPAPIGGTSAGMAILGEFSYAAMSPESLTSAVALADPYAADVTLARDFLALPRFEGVLTDQHFQERDRMGRTLVLLARLLQDGWSADPRAIAADRETAVHVDPATGIAEVFATAGHPTPYAWFLRPTVPPARCEPGQPLAFPDVDVYRIGPGGQFDLTAWQGQRGIQYRLSAEGGVLRSPRAAVY